MLKLICLTLSIHNVIFCKRLDKNKATERQSQVALNKTNPNNYNIADSKLLPSPCLGGAL